MNKDYVVIGSSNMIIL